MTITYALFGAPQSEYVGVKLIQHICYAGMWETPTRSAGGTLVLRTSDILSPSTLAAYTQWMQSLGFNCASVSLVDAQLVQEYSRSITKVPACNAIELTWRADDLLEYTFTGMNLARFCGDEYVLSKMIGRDFTAEEFLAELFQYKNIGQSQPHFPVNFDLDMFNSKYGGKFSALGKRLGVYLMHYIEYIIRNDAWITRHPMSFTEQHFRSCGISHMALLDYILEQEAQS